MTMTFLTFTNPAERPACTVRSALRDVFAPVIMR
jgi:hypothetical protein